MYVCVIYIYNVYVHIYIWSYVEQRLYCFVMFSTNKNDQKISEINIMQLYIGISFWNNVVDIE